MRQQHRILKSGESYPERHIGGGIKYFSIVHAEHRQKTKDQQRPTRLWNPQCGSMGLLPQEEASSRKLASAKNYISISHNMGVSISNDQRKSASAHQKRGSSPPSISQSASDNAANHQTNEVQATAQAHLLMI